MNTGAEAVETALKLARKWGYEKKGIRGGEGEGVECGGEFSWEDVGCYFVSFWFLVMQGLTLSEE